VSKTKKSRWALQGIGGRNN